MRVPLMAGNLKMYLDRTSLRSLLLELRQELTLTPPACDVALCPPFPLLPLAQDTLAGSTIGLGAQDLYWEREGAFTGEVSAAMLRETGCRYVIVGHSERRSYFGETDETVARKTRAALANGLVPIVCVGETEEERRAGATPVVLARQVVGGLSGLGSGEGERVVVAYEPVWAIGTGRTATPELAQEAHQHLRGELAKVLGPEVASRTRILYGGSVKPDNAASLLECPDIDGALVGGASLKPQTFLPIVRAAVRG